MSVPLRLAAGPPDRVEQLLIDVDVGLALQLRLRLYGLPLVPVFDFSRVTLDGELLVVTAVRRPSPLSLASGRHRRLRPDGKALHHLWHIPLVSLRDFMGSDAFEHSGTVSRIHNLGPCHFFTLLIT